NSAEMITAIRIATGYHHQGVRSDSRYATFVLVLRDNRTPHSSVARRVTFGRVMAATEDCLQVLVQRLDADVPLPSYAMPGDAGADIVTTVDAVLKPGQRAVL